MSGEMCTDNRFEIIAAYKKKLIDGTNIESSQDEMAVIDNILFRFWQMGWLPPIPHGDLIDRDKLRAKEFIHDGDAYAVVMSRDIRNAPTVIPASWEG